MTLKKDQIYSATIQKLNHLGFGIASLYNTLISIPNTLPQDQITFKLIKKSKKINLGILEKIDNPSPYRTQSPCPHFPFCGGCQFINVNYQNQLDLKKQILQESITTSSLPQKISSIFPAKSNLFYRNKMEFSFGTNQKGNIILGLKKRGNYKTIIPITNCQLLSPISNQILKFTQNFFQKSNLTTYSYNNPQGILRHFIIRHSKTNNQYMLNLIVYNKNYSIFKSWANQIQAQFSEIKSIYLTQNQNLNDSTYSTNIHLLSGIPQIQENFNNIKFNISPFSFFQTNTQGAIILYNQIRNLIPSNTSNLLDLYSGTGTIGLYCANKTKNITGIEEIPSSISDAQENAKINNIQNAHYILGRVKNILKFQKFNPDTIIIDPPRSGIVPKALKRIIEIKSPQIIYISCNPRIFFLQELPHFQSAGYKITFFKAYDQFPNTRHLESIIALSL